MWWGKKFPHVSWEQSFDELMKYQRAFKSCNIPMNSTSPLAKWVSNQRKEYRRRQKGKDSILTLEQIEQLNEVDFNWNGPRLD